MAITISGGVQLSGPVVLTQSSGGGGGSYSFQGSNYGYTSGGSSPAGTHNTIDKFPFTSDTNASDVGDLTTIIKNLSGQSSATNGYTSGGENPSVGGEAAILNRIEKFPFSADSNASDIADLTVTRMYLTGHSYGVSGYTSGGEQPYHTPRYKNTIEKFPFSSDSNASDVGDLTVARSALSGHSSSTHGYSSGGYDGPKRNTIDKFPFASDANSTDVGDLISAIFMSTGQSSDANGYVTGGRDPSNTTINVIQKYSFSTDGNASDISDLSESRRLSAGQSSTDNGYTSGGINPGTTSNVIDKFPFASDANATDVGDLTINRTACSGQQY